MDEHKEYKHDAGETPEVLGGEQPSDSRERSFPHSADSHSADCVLSLSALVEQYQREFQAYRRGDPTYEGYGRELLHRAIMQGDQDAWDAVRQCLGEIVLGWLRAHPSREVAYRWATKESYVALAFERFWQATANKQVPLRTLDEGLAYLRASLNGALLDTLRAYARPGEVSLLETVEPSCEDRSASLELTEILQSVLLSEREQRLTYLLYHCNLKPREIVNFYPNEWSDVQEIYRQQHNIIELVLLNVDLLCWQPDYGELL